MAGPADLSAIQLRSRETGPPAALLQSLQVRPGHHVWLCLTFAAHTRSCHSVALRRLTPRPRRIFGARRPGTAVTIVVEHLPRQVSDPLAPQRPARGDRVLHTRVPGALPSRMKRLLVLAAPPGAVTPAAEVPAAALPR